ncbi:hypothetical protein FRC00_007828, partial [Tulasnella sp. 408]
MGSPSHASESSCRDKQINQLPEGLYVIRNKMARSVLDVCKPQFTTPFFGRLIFIEGYKDEGTLCRGCWQLGFDGDADFGHQRWLFKRATSKETYTLKNIQYSRYLEVSEG